MSEKETVSKRLNDERNLAFFKESVEGLIYWGNALHPDFLGEDAAIKELLDWVPDNIDIEEVKASPGYEEGDEKAPFFTETYLYRTLGKGDARTLLRMMRDALGRRATRKL